MAPSILSTLTLATVLGVRAALGFTDTDTCHAGCSASSSNAAVSASVLIQQVQQNLLSGPKVVVDEVVSPENLLLTEEVVRREVLTYPKAVVDEEVVAPRSNKAEPVAHSANHKLAPPIKVDQELAPPMNVDEALSNFKAAQDVDGAKSTKQDASAANLFKRPKSITSFHSMFEKKYRTAAGIQTSATLQLGVAALSPEPLSMLQMSSMHRGMARLAAKTSPRTHKTLRGWTAPLDEHGYKAIVELKSDDDMEMFIRRVVDAYDSKIVNQGGFMGIVPWFSGTTSASTYEKLQETLLYAVLSNTKNPWLVYKNTDGTTGSSADLSFMGYVEVAASRNHDEMVKFARRVCDKLGVEVTDEPGFNSMVRFYSGAESFQDYGKLEQEITSAAAAPHTWAAKKRR